MVNIQATNQSCLNNSFVDESKTVTPQTPNNIPHSSSAESQASVRSPSNHPSMDETQRVQSQCLNHDSLDRTQNVNPSFSSQSPQRFPNMTTSICTNFQNIRTLGSSHKGYINVRTHRGQRRHHSWIWVSKDEIWRSFGNSFDTKIQERCNNSIVKIYDVVPNDGWVSSFVPVLKPHKNENPTIRWVSDFCPLNEKTKPLIVALPSVEDNLLLLSNSKYFSSLDFSQGYFHLEVHPDSLKYLYGACPYYLICYQKRSFGLRNAGVFFMGG